MFWGTQDSTGGSVGTRKSIGAPGALLGASGRGTPKPVGVELTCLLHLHTADVAPGGSGVPPPLRALGGSWGRHKLPLSPKKSLVPPTSHWPLVPRWFTRFLDYNSRKTAGARRTPIAPRLRFPSCPAARERPVRAGTVL